jgi:hypothetical protein
MIVWPFPDGPEGEWQFLEGENSEAVKLDRVFHFRVHLLQTILQPWTKETSEEQ